MKLKKLATILLASLLTVSSLNGCGSKAEPLILEISESDLENPGKVTVTKGNIRATTMQDAFVEPYLEQLYFEEEGKLGKIYVKVGDRVTKGTVLVSLNIDSINDAITDAKRTINDLTEQYNYNHASLENDLKIAKIRLEAALDEVSFISKNADGTYTSADFTAACVKAGNFDSEVRRVELKIKQLEETYNLELPHAKKELTKLQNKTKNSKLTAPFDGVIVAVAEAEPGEIVSKDKYYVAICDETKVVARCESLGVSFVKSALYEELFVNGEIYNLTYIPRSTKYTKEMRNSTETQFDEFYIEGNIENLSFSDTGLIIYVVKEKEDVLWLPVNAVHYSGESGFVYKDEAGKYVKTEVKIGMKNSTQCEITEGLSEGDVVYVQE